MACSARIERRQQLVIARRRGVRPGDIADFLSAQPERRASVRPLGKQRHATWEGESLGSPRGEAAALAELVKRGRCTVEDVRDLIAVPGEVADTLRKFDEVTGRRAMNRVLAWRGKVLAEFQRMTASGVQSSPAT